MFPPSKNMINGRPEGNLALDAVSFKVSVPWDVTKMQTLDMVEHGDGRIFGVAVNVDVLDMSVLHWISPRGVAIGKVGLDKLWTWKSLHI